MRAGVQMHEGLQQKIMSWWRDIKQAKIERDLEDNINNNNEGSYELEGMLEGLARILFFISYINNVKLQYFN